METRPMLEDIDTPALVVDLDIMERNLERMAKLCRDTGVALRPHTKTHKTPELAWRQMELGACGITVAKLSEAEVMAEHGLNDILIAYQVVGPHKLKRLVELVAGRRGTGFKLTLAVDSVENAALISNAGIEAGVPIPALIEVDSGLGRAGVGTVEEAVSLARHLRLFPGLVFAGIMTHEGHVGRDGPTMMAERAATAAQFMQEVGEAIRRLGMDCSTTSVGSTPAALYMAGAPGVTEMRPGTYIFHDRTQVLLGAAREEDCALTVLSTVTSVQGGARAALDAGTKALTSDGIARLGSYGAIDGDPEAVLGACSEEHGHLDLSHSSKRYAVGDRVHILPNHVCPAVNLSDWLYGYRDGKLECEWRIAARGCVR